MGALSRNSKGYALENLLVLVMVGSAVALQLMRRRQPEGVPAPLLVRLIDEVPAAAMPWPLAAIRELIG